MKRRITQLWLAAVVLAASQLSATLTTSSHRQTSFGSAGDIEPAILTQMRSGVEYQVAVWMEFGVGSPAAAQLKYSSFNNGNATGGYLGKPAGYNERYADPLLAQNTSGRIYLVGLTSGDQPTEPSAILRWYSDNGGQTWSSPLKVTEAVALAPAGTPQPAATVHLDKPSIAVSTATGSAGYVYIAYVREGVGAANGTNQIVLRVSTNNGTSFSNEIPVSPLGAGHHSPQVMVDPVNGEVNVVWLQDGADTLHYQRMSAFNGTGMTTIQTLANVVGNFTLNVAAGTQTIRALTTHTAKLDAVRRSIGVTWHETQNNVARAVFQTIDLVNGLNQAAWRNNRVTLPTKGGHDLQPSLAFDTSGNALVTYYAFGSNNSTDYWHVGQYITFDAQRNPVLESPNATVDLTPSPSSATFLHTVNNLTLMGEYHDVSFVNGTFKTVGILAFDYSNVFVYTTQHY